MKKFLNSNHLKVIAIIAMTLDHGADLLFPGFPVAPAAILLHAIGRLTAPIMWFFLCEGFFYTRNLGKYIARMFSFAIISHFAYCFGFGIPVIPFTSGVFNQTSVIWSLSWTLVALWVLNGKNTLKQWQKTILILLICLITFPADWSCIPVMAVVCMYDHRGDLNKQTIWMMIWVGVYAVVSFFFVNRVYGLVQFCVIFVYPILQRYNGEKGSGRWMKWFFYLYYPAHLIIVGLIRLAAYGNVPILFS